MTVSELEMWKERALKAEGELCRAISERDLARLHEHQLRGKLLNAAKQCPGICGASSVVREALK